MGCGVIFFVIKCTYGALTSERKCGVYSVSMPSRSGVGHRTHVNRLWSAWIGWWSTWRRAGSTKGETALSLQGTLCGVLTGLSRARRPPGGARKKNKTQERERAGPAGPPGLPARRGRRPFTRAGRGLTGRSRFGQLRCDSVRVTSRAVGGVTENKQCLVVLYCNLLLYLVLSVTCVHHDPLQQDCARSLINELIKNLIN